MDTRNSPQHEAMHRKVREKLPQPSTNHKVVDLEPKQDAQHKEERENDPQIVMGR